MKILFILTYYYPHWTGLTQYAKRLAEGLTKYFNKITVLTTKHETNLKEEEIINGIKVIRKPILFRLSRTLISLSLVTSLYGEILKSDRIVVYLPFSEVLIVSFLCRLLKRKLFLVHNGDLKLPKGLINRIIEKIYYLSTYLSIYLSTAVIIQTGDYGDNSELLSRFKHKWQIIPPLFIKPKASLPKFDKSDRIVGFAGRFVEEKGFDILLTAIPLVLKKIPKVKFVYAGQTNIPYENFYHNNKKLIDKYKGYLEFKGKLAEKEMSAFYKKLDVFVIPSRSDCFPSVGVEAMLSGIPLVVTDIPGARQQVKLTHMGEIVPPSDPSALAEGIIKVLKNRNSYIKHKSQVEKVFDYEKTLGKYGQILK